MNRTNLFSLLSLILLFLLFFHRPVCGQGKPEFALKTGVLSPFAKTISFEVETLFKPKVAAFAQVGITIPPLAGGKARVEGFYLKAGPKVYLFGTKGRSFNGFAIRPEVVFAYRKLKRWVSQSVANIYQTSMGGFVSFSYQVAFFQRITLEPHIGFGYLPSFEQIKITSVAPPFESTKSNWSHSETRYYHPNTITRHFLSNDLAVNWGVNFGVILGKQ